MLSTNAITMSAGAQLLRVPSRKGGRGRRRVACAAIFAAVCSLLAGGTAHAQLTLVPGSVEVIAANSADPNDLRHANPNDLVTQAGAHPFMLTTAFALESEVSPNPDDFGALIPSGSLKDIDVDLPAGFVGNPTAMPTCPQSAFNNFGNCPPSTQVGYATIDFGFGGFDQAVYNLAPSRGEPARFAFFAAGVVGVHMTVDVRTGGDYGLRVRLRDLPQGLGVISTRLTLWGVPADARHDPQRGGVGAGVEPRPFLTLPTQCTAEPLTATLRFNSWQQPGRLLDAETTMLPQITGCDGLSFRPSIDVIPDTRQAGAPAGYTVEVGVPQTTGPDQLATPALRTAVVRMPEGVVIAPGSAYRLEGCEDARFAVGSAAPATCPDGSKIGTVVLNTPLLPDDMRGDIYFGQPRGNDPQSGEMLRLFLQLDGSGVRIKLQGAIVADPRTGQLTATFDDNPQLPFRSIRLAFISGPLSPLANPTSCGTATTTATLTSYGGQVATVSSSFEVSFDGNGAPCPPRPFAPSFVAGTFTPAGGADSPFTLSFGRGDGDQMLSAVTVDMPEGLLARIGDVPVLCADAAAAAGTCGEGARVGSVRVAAGPGSQPFRLPGRVYIAGPYKGAPFSLSIVVPAVAGPLDLGVVVVRAAIFVDRRTVALRVVADPMPSILSGIPLQIRDVEVAIDRPRFMLNPTSCAPKRVSGAISALTGVVASVGSRFQVGSCASLPFAPKVTIRAGARGRTRGRLTTPLAVTLQMRDGEANNRSVQVTLPRNVNARLKVVNDACSLDEFNAGAARCKPVGSAVAQTPLLRDPLRGRAYFVRNPARRLPDLMVALKGQGRAAEVAVDLAGKVTVSRSLALTTTFDDIPDVPISRFTLRLVAGRQGPVGFVRNACTRAARRQRAAVVYRSHSGKVVRLRQRLSMVGCRGASRARG